MAIALSDRVKERVFVIGTGAVQVGSTAPTGFQNFPAVMTVDGPPSWICIADTFSGAWEVSVSGLIAGDKLARAAENVLSSSSGPGVLVNFPGNVCDVFQTVPASAAIQGAASVSLNSPQFGAVPDDPTFDNAAAITAWLQYAAANNLTATGHGTFYLTTVDTVLPGPLSVDGGEHLVFWGMGTYPGTTTPVPGAVITISGNLLYSGYWVGADVNNSDRQFIPAAASGTALQLKYMKGVYVNRSNFNAALTGYIPISPATDPTGDSGIGINQCTNVTIENCGFIGQPDKGIYITGGPLTDPSDDFGPDTVSNCFFYRCQTSAASTRQCRQFMVLANHSVEGRTGFGRFEAGEGSLQVSPGREIIAIGNYVTRVGSRAFMCYGEGGDIVIGNNITDWGYDYNGVANQPNLWAIGINGARCSRVAHNVLRFQDWTPVAGSIGVNLRRHDLLNPTRTLQCVGNIIEQNLFQGIPIGINESDSTTGTVGQGNTFDNVAVPFVLASGSGSHIGFRDPTGVERPFFSAMSVGKAYAANAIGAGFIVAPTGETFITAVANSPLRLNRTGSVGIIQNVYQDAVAIASIQSLTATLGAFVGAVRFSSFTAAQLNAGTPAVPANSGTVVYCSDGASGSPCLALANGAIWRNAGTGAPLAAT